MTLESFIDLLEENTGFVRKSGNGWEARCPAHDDQHASLSISENEEGKILLKCHAGCNVKDVLDALELGWPDIGGTEIFSEKVYPYVDEEGTSLYEVVRKPGKEFFQRRVLADGTTENQLGDVRRVLYRLPEIIGEEDFQRTVFICEGEKDVEAFRDMGYLATCNVGGAGKWQNEYSEFLKGRYVSIVQDKDEAGRKHASQVMLSLKSHVASVRLLEPRIGKDAYDHFQGGYDVDDFVEPSYFTPLDFTKPFTPVEWVWDGYIAEGDLALISGAPGLGKSWLTMGLATAIANGYTEFLDCPVKNGRVLYFDEENPTDVVVTRMIQRLQHHNFDRIRYISAEGLRLDTHPELLMQEVLVYQPSIIFIDSLARVHAKEENSFQEMSEILNQVLKPLARETGAAVVLIHHSDKGGHGPRGSGDIEAAVDVSIGLKGASGSGAFGVRIRKSRRRKSDDGMFVIIEDQGSQTRLKRNS